MIKFIPFDPSIQTKKEFVKLLFTNTRSPTFLDYEFLKDYGFKGDSNPFTLKKLKFKDGSSVFILLGYFANQDLYYIQEKMFYDNKDQMHHQKLASKTIISKNKRVDYIYFDHGRLPSEKGEMMSRTLDPDYEIIHYTHFERSICKVIKDHFTNIVRYSYVYNNRVIEISNIEEVIPRYNSFSNKEKMNPFIYLSDDELHLIEMILI